MFLAKSFRKSRRTSRLAVYTAALCWLFSISPSGIAQESSDKLPSSPDTGSPEEEFTAGGTRDNHWLTKVCGKNGPEIIYLLGDRNREFTLSAHPTFWFYIPQNLGEVAQIEFVLTELETGKKIYERVVPSPEKSGTVGIALPPESQYALTPEVNYSWSLKVDCAESKPEIALEGWLSRMPFPSHLQNQLASTIEKDRYNIYLQHNLLYDAVDELARHRLAEPDNPQLTTAWNQLLVELGWQKLMQQLAVEPCILDMQISSKNK